MSEIFQTKDATWLNHIANKPRTEGQTKPSIFELVTLGMPGVETINCDDIAARDDHIIVTNGEDAFLVLVRKSPVIYELHIVFDDTCRGRRALTEGKRMVEWIWNNTPIICIYGAVPIANKGCRMFNRLLGCISDGKSWFDGAYGTYYAEWFRLMRPTLDS